MLYNGIVDQTDTDAVSGFEPVVLSEKHFGINALINNALELQDSFPKLASDLSLSTLRYPGGTVTEKFFRLDKFNGVDFKGIVDVSNSTLLGFDEFLDIAGNSGLPVSIVIPTKYGLKLSDTDALYTTAGEALIAGRYGERIHSDEYISAVSSFIIEAMRAAAEKNVVIEAFEIGNEFWSGGEMTAIEYGRLASVMAVEIQDVLSDLELNTEPQIIVQSISSAGFFSPRNDKTVWIHEESYEVVDGKPQGTNWIQKTIDVSQISGGDEDWRATEQRMLLIDEFEATPESVSAIDGIVEHYYETGGFSKVDTVVQGSFQEDFTGLFLWEEQLGKDFDFHISEWNVQRNGLNNRGLEHASMLVEMLYEMSTHGIQTAQAWPLFSQYADSTALYIDGNEDRITFAGHSFSMMSESLVGLAPFLDFETEDGVIDIHGFDNVQLLGLDSNAARQVYFISSRVAEERADVFLDFGSLAPFSTIEVESSYFLTITSLSDGYGDGKNANALPVLSHSNGQGYKLEELSSIQISSEWGNDATNVLDGYSLTRGEITYVSDSDDRVSGRGGDDKINGFSGDDTLSSGDGEDTIDGGSGDDVINAGSGNDSVLGSSGRDWVSLDSGDDFFRDDPEWSTSGSDTVFGGLGDDTIAGWGGNDSFLGEAGNDLIYGGSGADTISGGLGNDSLLSGRDNDSVEGGEGNDWVSLGDGDDFFRDEVEFGTAGQDTVFGDAGNDTIAGWGGNDRFDGGDGNDLIYGGFGRDTVTGGSGRDWIDLGPGDDTYFDTAETGAAGRDTITGGTGADTFVFFDEVSQDVITDFELGIDTLQLTSALVSDRSAQSIVDELATVADDGVLITFGVGQTIFLQDLTGADSLALDIAVSDSPFF